MGKLPTTIKIDLSVYRSLVRMYDRYMEVAVTDDKNPIMSFADFVSQLVVRGMIEYGHHLMALEKELGILD